MQTRNRSAQRRAWDAVNRISSDVWAEWLADPDVIMKYNDKRYRRGPDDCTPWLGAISDGGHARMRIGRHVVAAHVLGYQISRGLLLPDPDGLVPVIRHTCDFAACQNATHWTRGTVAQNSQDYAKRRYDPLSPLADTRGPAGRARAIRDAILAAQRDGATPQQVERVIWRAMSAGIRGTQAGLW